MSILNWIKPLWAARGTVLADAAIAKTAGTIKPGIATSEFWTKVLTIDIPMLVDLFTKASLGLDPRVAAWVLLGSNLGYIAFRTFLKGRAGLLDVLQYVQPIIDDAKQAAAGQRPTPIVVDNTTTVTQPAP